MKIALIEAPQERIQTLAPDEGHFYETPFPIYEFLSSQKNVVYIWDYRALGSFDARQMVRQIREYQPVVIGINDHYATNGLVLETLIKQLFPNIMLFFVPGQMTVEELMDHANQAAFSLRHRTKPMSGRIRLRGDWNPEALRQVFPAAAQLEQVLTIEAAYCRQYDLAAWRDYLPLRVYLRNLYMLEILETCLPPSLVFWQEKLLRVLDIGSGQWFYGPAVYQFFRHAYTPQPRKVFLTGIELDPYRVDEEGYSCVDHALSYVDPITSHCRYLIQDFLQHQPSEPYHVILHMLPLVLAEAHLRWGLPAKYYRPADVLRQALALLGDQGVLLVANEIEPEFETLQALLAQLSFKPLTQAAFYSQLRRSQGGFVSLLAKGKA